MATSIERRGFLKLGGLAVTALGVPPLLSACSVGASSPTGGGGGFNGTLHVSMPTDVASLDPQKTGDLPSMSVASNIFDTLTTRDADDKLVGCIATSWKAVDDKTWRFTIRDGVTFHNGEPCDAAAVAFSINRLVAPKTASPIVELRYVKAAHVVDSHTVDFEMTAPDPIIPEKVSLFGGVIVPPKYLAEQGDAGFAAHPVGTGPFRFVSRQQDNEIVLEGNSTYWGGASKVTHLTFKIVPTLATAVSALQSGGLDIVTGLTPDAVAQLGGDITVKRVPGVREYYVALNTLDRGPLADAGVRKALNHAVDVPTLIKTLLSGAATRTETLFPKQVFGYDSSIQGYSYDPAKAKTLLAAAGYPHGFSTRLAASSVDQDVAQAIAGQLSKVGVTCEVQIMDATQFKSRLVSGNPKAMGPMYLSGNTAWTLDGVSLLQSTIRSDRRQSLWHNAKADRLIDAEEQTMEPQERAKAFSQLQQLLVDEAPFVFLYHSSNVYAMRAGIDWTIPGSGVLAMAGAAGK
ncbi:ABC transporter substrate-binding protein [Streptomyces sp. ME03-5709C]|nr:ABC transporter substrate-binding protein [Streptomyces sp. ME03-5709C]